MKEGEVDLKSITEEAKIENIAVITDFVNSILEANGCSAKVQMEIDIAIDEIFGNIAYYAYTPKTGEATVQVEIKNFPERLELMDEVSYEYADGKNILKLKKNL